MFAGEYGAFVREQKDVLSWLTERKDLTLALRQQSMCLKSHDTM